MRHEPPLRLYSDANIILIFTGGVPVGRPKKFQKPRNVSFTVETAEHQALRLRATEKGKSLSDFIRTLALKEIQKK